MFDNIPDKIGAVRVDKATGTEYIYDGNVWNAKGTGTPDSRCLPHKGVKIGEIRKDKLTGSPFRFNGTKWVLEDQIDVIEDLSAVTILEYKAPVAIDGSYSNIGSYNLVQDISSLISDPEDADSSLTPSIVSGPSHGTLTWSGQTFTYIPDPGYEGTDSFEYKVNDGIYDSDHKTISLSGIDTLAQNSISWTSNSPDTQNATYDLLTATLGENIDNNIIGQSGTTSKGGTYIITGVSGNIITFSYTSPSGLIGTPIARKDTITFTSIKDLAGNTFGNVSLITSPLA